MKLNKSRSGLDAIKRQADIVDKSNVVLDKQEGTYLEMYSYDSGPFVNNYLRHGINVNYQEDFFPPESRIARDSHGRTARLLKVVDRLPSTGNVTLYRGGSGQRGTSGIFFRTGQIKVGDILVNTDFSSFTESLVTAFEFAMVKAEDGDHFDDTSVIFMLGNNLSAKVMAPYSLRSKEPYFEAESLMPPGHAFKVCAVEIKHVEGGGRVVEVKLEEVNMIKSIVRKGVFSSSIEFPDNVYDLRTGDKIDIDCLIERLGIDEVKKLGII
ncbi:TPA: hypothetical protein SIA35_004186 [Aeromonas sobria]|nr:hypothetical protein [Aeromonas sobria]